VVVLFGCGGDRDQSKRQEMGKIASAYADYVIVTSDNSRGEDVQTIISQICKGMDCSCPCAVIPNRKEAIRFAVWNAKPYDLILLAGKGHEQYEITRDEKRPFSEKEIVLECFNERLKQSRQCYAKESDL
jgi:UDP-N-acetylmuramoyl-L-alanyl-D-glutamate--2,6-diaminopimelate ligase